MSSQVPFHPRPLGQGWDGDLFAEVTSREPSDHTVDLTATQLDAHAASGNRAHFIWWTRGNLAYQLAIYSNHDPIPKGVIQNLTEGIEMP